MDFEDEVAIASFFLIISGVCAHLLISKLSRVNRKIWVKPYIQKRSTLGAYNGIMAELRLFDGIQLKNYLRMSTETFQKLLVRFDTRL
jgi:hypothetical protein